MRVLVIEDEPNLQSLIEAGLAAEGFMVDIAGDGDTGFWMATEHAYSLILLDVMLPGRNGYRVCRDLRAEGINTPILMLTAKDGDYDQAEGLDTGADDYLTKPFSFVVLLARIRALLRRSGDLSDSVDVICVGDLELRRSTRTVHRDGQMIALTPREFALLDVLAAEPGRVFSRDYLLTEVWGADTGSGTNVVAVYIGYLRRKVESLGGAGPIQTVQGHGYRLAP